MMFAPISYKLPSKIWVLMKVATMECVSHFTRMSLSLASHPHGTLK